MHYRDGCVAAASPASASKVANALGAKFIDGDDLHPRANIQKMAAGNPLNDEDRAPWLERIRDAAYSLERRRTSFGVIVCSALKKQYRDQIREGNDSVHFLFLDGSQSLILERMRARQGHFMREAMVQSQFDTLERPDGEPGVFRIDIDGTFEQVVDRAVTALAQAQ